ncbi:hypothetical protein D5086_010863 [Populus alba]|uniref:Uncharacterized protein n=1 Tax=Populus alba TaxID=43335 RepID=A0ACC4CAJ3_POPAL
MAAATTTNPQLLQARPYEDHRTRASIQIDDDDGEYEDADGMDGMKEAANSSASEFRGECGRAPPWSTNRSWWWCCYDFED